MTVQVLQESFQKAVRIGARACENITATPILSHIHLQTDKDFLNVSSSNLELSILSQIPMKTDAEAIGITIHGRTLLEVLSLSAQGRVNLDLDSSSQTLKITSGLQTINMRGFKSEVFPDVKHLEDPQMVMEGAVLSDMIKQVLFAVSKESYSRPTLAGVFCQFTEGELIMASSDGFRLSERKGHIESVVKDLEYPFEAIVPMKVLDVIQSVIGKGEEVQIALSDKLITFFTSDRRLITSNLISGKYPAYQSVIPQRRENKVSLNKEGLFSAISRANIFASDNANSVDLKASKLTPPGGYTNLYIRGRSLQKGDSEDMISLSECKEDIDITVNGQYLKDVLVKIDEDKVDLFINSGVEPIVVRAEGREDFVHVIMPLASDRSDEP